MNGSGLATGSVAGSGARGGGRIIGGGDLCFLSVLTILLQKKNTVFYSKASIILFIYYSQKQNNLSYNIMKN